MSRAAYSRLFDRIINISQGPEGLGVGFLQGVELMAQKSQTVSKAKTDLREGIQVYLTDRQNIELETDSSKVSLAPEKKRKIGALRIKRNKYFVGEKKK